MGKFLFSGRQQSAKTCHRAWIDQRLQTGPLQPRTEFDSEIQRAFRFFYGPIWYGMRVDHRRFQIAVAKQLLNSANIDVGL